MDWLKTLIAVWSLIFAVIYLTITATTTVFPQVLVSLLSKQLAVNGSKRSRYPLCKDIRRFTFRGFDVFTLNSAKETKYIWFHIPGGFFVRSRPELDVLSYIRERNNHILNHTTVFSITYPTRFQFTVAEILHHLEECIQKCIYDTENKLKLHLDRNRKHNSFSETEVLSVSLSGYSAGAYFATRILSRLTLTRYFDKFIGICGYYGRRTVSNPLIRALDQFYLHGLFNINHSFIPVVNTRSYILACREDLLLESSLEYTRAIGQKPHLFNGGHTSFLKIGTIENIALLDEISVIVTSSSPELVN